MTGLGPVLFLALAVAACSGPREAGRTDANAMDGANTSWSTPPRIESVRVEADGLRISGRTEPGGRVVLRGPDGAAFAASADSTGRFELRMPAPDGDLMLAPESLRGHESSPASSRLLLLDGGRGPIALVSAGAPTRRLDAAPVLGAVDSDGEAMILSGQAEPGEAVAVSVAGGAPVTVVAGPDGAWRLTTRATGPASVAIGGADFAYSGSIGVDGQGGRRIDWVAADGARLNVWLPVAAQ